jgi:hypothetical protein
LCTATPRAASLIEHRAVKRKRQRDLAALALALDRRVELAEEADLAFLAEPDHVARCELLAGLGKGAPARAVDALGQRRLDPGVGAAADATAHEPRRDHLGVVDHQRVAGIEQVRQIAHAFVLKPRRAARTHHEQPRRIARRDRPQRDAFGWKIEVEEIGAHGTLSLPGLTRQSMSECNKVKS